MEDVEIAGLGIDGADLLSIAGNAGVLVRQRHIRRSCASIGRRRRSSTPPPPPCRCRHAVGDVGVGRPDLDRRDRRQPRLGGPPVGHQRDREGLPDRRADRRVRRGDRRRAKATKRRPGRRTDQAVVQEEHEPDDNGIDDPPVAVDDPVTARARGRHSDRRHRQRLRPRRRGDRALRRGRGRHGTVDIQTATTVSYLPDRTTSSGVDQFDYTIVDGDGTEDSATVTIELLAGRHRQPGADRVTRRRRHGGPTHRSTSTC